MSLGSKHKASEIWDGILEKTEKKLSGWKAQYLSFGGRLILINSVLDSLPTYVMSLFPIPAKVVAKLDKLRRRFLWQGNKDGKGYSLVNWKSVLLSKDRGGLGIKNLRLQNESLLKKWLWRYTEEGNALWKEVITAKYGELNPWCTENTAEPYGVGVWRTIRSLWSQMEVNLYIKLGNGTKAKFWKDVWIDQSPLRDLFPNLFQICVNPDANVSDCWTEQGWDLVFRRPLNDWEVEKVAELLGTLGGVIINTSATDRMLWKHSKDGLFSVNSAYRRGQQVMAGRPNHLWNYFWKGDIPTKVKGFTWLVIKRACLTQEVLQKKGRQLVPRCFLCNLTGETNSRLFLHCHYTTQIWNLFLSISSVNWTMPEHTSEVLKCWNRRGGSRSEKRWWRLIPSCIWWSVWRERNVPKGKKRKADSGTEKGNVSVEKLVKIQIPSTLKKQLVDDWEFIMHQNKLVKLPRSPTVDDILTKYLEYRSKKDGMMTDSVGEILNGIRCYFDKALPALLLYKKERQQYREAVSDNVSPSSVYGAEHLLRLFVKLPELIACAKIEEETLSKLQQKFLDFLKFLQKNQGTFFLSAYDGPKASEGSGKDKES